VNPKDVMSMQEALTYLAMDEATLRALVAERRIPCLEMGGTWVFSKKSIDKWRALRERRRS
jgi:excisionase family DNA binding protein